MAKSKAKRPIDVKDTLWSAFGKDTLDAMAERLWNGLRDAGQMHNTSGADMGPYHVQSSASQTAAQQAVLDVVGSAVPALLRERAKSYRGDPEYGELYEQLRELADEIASDHG